MAELKLKRRSSFMRRTATVSDAVETHCAADDWSGDELQVLQRANSQTAKLLGSLIATLHERGTLPTKDVLELLDDAWEVAE